MNPTYFIDYTTLNIIFSTRLNIIPRKTEKVMINDKVYEVVEVYYVIDPKENIVMIHLK